MRPDDFVPPIAKLAPTPAAARDRFRNCRRLSCDLDIALPPHTNQVSRRALLNVKRSFNMPIMRDSERDSQNVGQLRTGTVGDRLRIRRLSYRKARRNLYASPFSRDYESFHR